MKSKQIRRITHGAILAALYVALTYLQNWLLPGTTSAAIQFRASEALCIFALFTPGSHPRPDGRLSAVHISNAGALPLDWLVGTGATLLATTCMYLRAVPRLCATAPRCSCRRSGTPCSSAGS